MEKMTQRKSLTYKSEFGKYETRTVSGRHDLLMGRLRGMALLLYGARKGPDGWMDALRLPTGAMEGLGLGTGNERMLEEAVTAGSAHRLARPAQREKVPGLR
jgi:hypothetical protein